MSTTKLTAAQKRRNQRVSHYLQLVRPVACHYARRCREPLDDLLQVGLLGLLRAAELYSQASGTPFDAFARPHIRGAILHYLRDGAPILRLPRRLGERHHQLQRARRQWLAQHGCEPQVRDLRGALGLTQVQWDQLQQACQMANVLPLNATRLEQDPAPAGESPDQLGLQALSALAELQPGLRDVVRQVVLEGRSYRTTAAALEVSPMTVQRRLHRGLAELRLRLTASAPQPHRVGSAAAAC
jgi:RNA polymerase sigma-B factor